MEQITMELYETDMHELQKFIANKKIEEEFTEEYIILYDFAIDCKYSKCIQSELIRYLLPFYLKTVEQAVLHQNKIARDIYFEFNRAIFFNQKNLKVAVGEENYEYLMELYIELTIKKMEQSNSDILEWVSLFNTTVAFGNGNIQSLFFKIFAGPLKIKYSFFQYLSILLFKESDDLLARKELKEFWTSNIWNFDDGYFTNDLFWSDDVVEFFDKEINRQRMELLFTEVKPVICDILGVELVTLLGEEMNKSFATGIFLNRKAEYLNKINSKSGEYMYWDTTF